MLSRKEYSKAKNYLENFVNYERKVFFPYRRSLKLKRVQFLFNVLNIPYHNLKVIHIAGTKGKGSTANLCANLLASSGYTIGLYTSPHFFSFRERIQILKSPKFLPKAHPQKIKNYFISKNDVIKIVRDIKPQLEKMRFTKKYGKLTFFEAYTAIAFKYFIEKNVDFAILETGLGGRLDATNVVKPLVCIITHIGYDHTDKLGTRLEEIAYEKAGIIKRGTWVVSSSQRHSAYNVIRARCAKMGAELHLFGKDFFADNIRIRSDYTIFDFSFNNTKLKNLKIFLKGHSQIENATCALAAISLLDEREVVKKEVNFKKGLENTHLEGRFEIVKKDPLVILDVAHNPSSFSVLAENLRIYFPRKKIILIFAASKDKDIKSMLDKIDSSFIILTSFPNPRSLSPLEIKERCGLEGAFMTEDINQAFKLAKKLYKNGTLILVSGSLFLVSEAKRLLQTTDKRPQTSDFK